MKTIVREGSSCIAIPEKCLTDPFHCEVFYNKAMSFNRTLSCLFLENCLEFANIKNSVLFDGFCGTGIRGIRYLKETSVKRVVFCDANDATIPFIKKNISLNRLGKNASVMHLDVNQGLSNSPCFDVIELDPFGSPVNFIDSAFRRGKKKFILSLTFTDLANLCGGHKDACKRYYSAASLRCSFSHELAMRIALAKVAIVASQFDFGVSLLVSWYEGHYVKVFLLCEKSAAKADENFNNIGYAWLCNKCLGRGVAGNNFLSCSCTGEPKFAGPLWVSAFSSKDILRRTLKNIRKSKENDKVRDFLLLLLNEIETPLFYSLPELCSRAKAQVPKLNKFIDKIRASGFQSSKTHFSPDCFKTNAPIALLFEVL